MTSAQRPVQSGDIRIVRIATNRILNVGNAGLWLAKEHECHAKVVERARIIGVERDRRLKFAPSLGQSVLHTTEHTHRKVRRRARRIALDRFSEQPLGARRVLLNRASPSLG